MKDLIWWVIGLGFLAGLGWFLFWAFTAKKYTNPAITGLYNQGITDLGGVYGHVTIQTQTQLQGANEQNLAVDLKNTDLYMVTPFNWVLYWSGLKTLPGASYV